MRKIACWAVDHAPQYQRACLVSIYSFLKHNKDWELVFYNVGASNAFIENLPQGFQIINSTEWVDKPASGGVHIPTSKVRCNLLAEQPGADRVVMYLDCDTVILKDISPIVDRFVASGKAIAIHSEPGQPVRTAWQNWTVPTKYSGNWGEERLMNTGFLLMSEGARAIGENCVSLFEEMYPLTTMGEQALIDSAIYELKVPYFSLTSAEHCIEPESHIRHEAEPHYLGDCFVGSSSIYVRHFCGTPLKPYLWHHLPSLMEYYVGRYIECDK